MTDSRAADNARAEDPTRPVPRGGEAVQYLRQSLERVERERQGLVRVAAGLDEFVRSQEARYAELEQELNDTALLYVASYQLQARSDPREVLLHLRELLEQLMGVEGFVLYVCASEELARPVSSRGVPASELTPKRSADAPLAAAFEQRAPVFASGAGGSPNEPLAVVPLLLGERVLGAITITKLFSHKASWAPVDGKLLQLLASHAASALLAAHLIQGQENLWGTLAALGEALE